jgi:hypothetical protein
MFKLEVLHSAGYLTFKTTVDFFNVGECGRNGRFFRPFLSFNITDLTECDLIGYLKLRVRQLN